MSPLFSPVSAGGTKLATLQQTITSTGSVTIPSANGFVYAIIGASPTSATAEGWVPADTSFSLTNGIYYYSCLSSTSGTNLYLYY